jgi:outer membrane protein
MNTWMIAWSSCVEESRVVIKRVVVGVIALVLLLTPSASAQNVQSLSLKEAEQRAVQNHPQIRAVQYAAMAADESVHQAKSAYFPTVYGSVTGAAAESGSRIAAGGLNNPIILNRLAAGFSIGQLITDFGRTHDLVESFGLRADAQRQDVDSRRADVLLQVDRAYFNALRARSVETVAQQTVSARQLVVDQVTALAASNLRSGLDVSFARVNMAEAQLLLVQARNDVEAAFTALSAAMGFSESVAYDLADDPLPTEPPADSTTLVTQALRDRPDVISARVLGQAASKFADAERALWNPTISTVAAAGLIPYHQEGLNNRYAAAGVNVNVPLANGGLFSARGAEAGLRARVEEQRLLDLENRVARDVRTAWLDARTAFLRLDLTAQLLTQASDASDLAQARYDIGLGSIVELSQAQLNKTRAELEQATARYDYQARTAVLKFQIGALK